MSSLCSIGDSFNCPGYLEVSCISLRFTPDIRNVLLDNPVMVLSIFTGFGYRRKPASWYVAVNRIFCRAYYLMIFFFYVLKCFLILTEKIIFFFLCIAI